MPASPEKLNLASMDVAADKQRLLRQLFPEAFTETTDAKGGDRLALDFDKLKAVLGVHGAMTEPGQERYGLDWPGKRDALRAVQAPSYGTLLPAPEESVDWENTKNVFIEGDNLEVLKLLQKSYYGKVKMIYIDPPYNTGNDFVYPDNYAESLETYLKYTGKIDDQGFKTTTNTKDSGRFHSNWLRMMYPRLYVAKNLLREDGVIFISIDDNTSDGTTAVRELFSAQYFDFPKPPELISMIADQASSMDDLVIDMFAGSGTGVHAIMALNAEDGGSRRCISVQLPEPCAESSEASRAGFKTIADIAKERIRRAGAKIRGEWKEKNAARETAHAQSEEKKAGDLFSESASLAASSHPPSPISNPFPPDTGFRVFKLAPSNFKRWDGEAAAVSKEALEQQMEASLDHIATGATEESILFEILLKAGYQLTCPMEKLELAGHTVYAIDGNSLFICVADRIHKEFINAVAEKHPVQFICLDRALQGERSSQGQHAGNLPRRPTGNPVPHGLKFFTPISP